jgi:hypothetical protein
MAINFPSTPTDGQTYDENGAYFKYSSAIGAWIAVPFSEATGLTVKIVSSDFIANASTLYVFTTGVTANLPASPATGQWIKFSNPTTNTNSVITRNGNKIMALDQNMVVDVPNTGFTLVYTDSTYGWVFIA